MIPRRPLLAMLAATALICGCAAPSTQARTSGSSGEVTVVDGEEPFSRYFDIEYVDSYQKAEDARIISVTECMADKGFEYEATVYPSPERVAAEATKGTRSYAEKFGYGYTAEFNDVAPKDPNLDRLEKMTPVEREEYWTALEGPVPPPADSSEMEGLFAEPEDGAEPEPAISGVDEEHNLRVARRTLLMQDAAYQPTYGCEGVGQAVYEEMTQPEPEQIPEVDYRKFDGLVAKAEDVYVAAERAAELSDLVAEWRSCMAGAGYDDFDWPSDPQLRSMQKWATAMGGEPPKKLRTLGSQIFAFLSDGQADLTELRSAEVALAVADFDCQNPLRDPAAQVLRQLQQNFVDDNRSELEAYRELMLSGG